MTARPYRSPRFDWEAAVARRLAGDTYAAIARDCGVSTKAVRKICRRAGIMPTAKRWNWLPAPPDQRFWEKVEKTGSCWTWLGAICPEGYGKFWHDGRHTYAHRFAYELHVGPIPVGLVIDHLCRNRACVNPEHLEVVTSGENIRRGYRYRKLRNAA